VTVASVVNYWPAWTAITVATLVMLNQAITESEKFANMLGRVGRAMYARSKRRYQMDQIEFSRAVRDAVGEERHRWEADEVRALNVVTGQMEYVVTVAAKQQEQLNELNFRVRCMTAYVEYEAEWHHRLRMLVLRADVNGGAVGISELPPHHDFAEFERKCNENKSTAWRTWGVL
jgi:hypothetical protein